MKEFFRLRNPKEIRKNFIELGFDAYESVLERLGK